jgi:hypothetical protein
MNRPFFALIPLIFFITLAADDCFTSMAPAVIQSYGDGLRGSGDKGAQAAGNSADAVDTLKGRRELEGKALSSNNLRMGDRMDFSSIDQLIKAASYEDRYYRDRAAMKVAAGKDEASVRQDLGMSLDGLNKKNTGPQDEQNLYEYMASLSNVQTGLGKGSPAWTRVHDALCAQQALYKSTYAKPVYYSRDSEEKVNNALAEGPC